MKKNKDRFRNFYKDLDLIKLAGSPSCLAMVIILIVLIGLVIVGFGAWMMLE